MFNVQLRNFNTIKAEPKFNNQSKQNSIKFKSTEQDALKSEKERYQGEKQSNSNKYIEELDKAKSIGEMFVLTSENIEKAGVIDLKHRKNVERLFS